MRVYRCDRCGKFVTLKARDFFLREPTKLYRFGSKMHLCDDCTSSFRRWFRNPESKDEE